MHCKAISGSSLIIHEQGFFLAKWVPHFQVRREVEGRFVAYILCGEYTMHDGSRIDYGL